MKIAIMQPYFLPYIGYFQLMNAVDAFVVYDNIEYTKKGWINRNRILLNGEPTYISLPLRKSPDHDHVRDKFIAEDFYERDRAKLMRRIEGEYRKAPCYEYVHEWLDQMLEAGTGNLFDFLLHSLRMVKERLEIGTPMIVSSTIDCDHTLKGADRVLSICKALGATGYLNPQGGVGIYDPERFRANGVDLSFLFAHSTSYDQFKEPFVPWLSILDVMMFNPVEHIREMLLNYDLDRPDQSE